MNKQYVAGDEKWKKAYLVNVVGSVTMSLLVKDQRQKEVEVMGFQN